jgi:hypothetical protein
MSLEAFLGEATNTTTDPLSSKPAKTTYLGGDRPEERAIEDVLKEEHISYTTPLALGDPYHDKRPDFYYEIEGLGRRGLEIKNRKPDSVQDEREVLRDFIKDSKFPVDYWGSFQVTNEGIEKIMEADPIGTVVHEPIGFKYEKDPEGWKRAFREFLFEKKKLAAYIVSERSNEPMIRHYCSTF